MAYAMALYFFDMYNKNRFVRDPVGTECDGFEAIRREAMHTLPNIARDEIPRDGDRQAFTVLVRDTDNLTVYTASLTFAGLWIGDVPIPEQATDDA